MTNNFSQFSRRALCQAALSGAVACASGSILETEGITAMAAEYAPGVVKLPRVKPGAVGISSSAISAFIDAVEQKVHGLNSFMLMRHGKVAAEAWWAPYAPQHPHMLYSLSKSFTSTAVGLAIHEGRLSVEDPVLKFFPESAPAAPSDNLKAMKVKHLLCMGTGHDKDATGPTTAAADGDWVKAFLSLPVEHEPGTHFAYNSAATYMLSAIVQKLTGQTVLAYLTPRLFEPLGITGPTWETCPKGINTGGWGLMVKTEDIARFGQLYLQQGQWAGKQVIPAAWVQEATTKKISNGDPNTVSDWQQGYCYQFWRCRHGAYRGDGAFGQFCVVMPELDAVLAITSGLGDMQAVLDCVWDHLLPGIQQANGAEDAGLDAMHGKIAGLQVPAPQGEAESATAKAVSGKTFTFDSNPLGLNSIKVEFHGKDASVSLTGAAGTDVLKASHSKWAPGTGHLPGVVSTLTAGKGAWKTADTYEMKLVFNETPFIETLTLTFAGNTVHVNAGTNYSFGQALKIDLTGKATA
jgi:CubicO group peptidase (beta-lactamase class C family)